MIVKSVPGVWSYILVLGYARHQCVKPPPPREGFNYYLAWFAVFFWISSTRKSVNCTWLHLVQLLPASLVLLITWIQVQFGNKWTSNRQSDCMSDSECDLCLLWVQELWESIHLKSLTTALHKQVSKPRLKQTSWTVTLSLLMKLMTVGIRSGTRQWMFRVTHDESTMGPFRSQVSTIATCCAQQGVTLTISFKFSNAPSLLRLISVHFLFHFYSVSPFTVSRYFCSNSII